MQIFEFIKAYKSEKYVSNVQRFLHKTENKESIVTEYNDEDCHVGIIKFDGKLSSGEGAFLKIKDLSIDPETLMYLDDRNEYLS